MLERAASCLNSSTRHISRRSHHPVRQLHSSFWHHGAGDLDLPSWWSVIEPIAAVVARREGDAKDVGFLDFLYPPKTLALMKKMSIHGVEGVVKTKKEIARGRKFSSRSGFEKDIDFVTAVMNSSTQTAPDHNALDSNALEASGVKSVEVSDHLLNSLMDEQPQQKYKVPDPLHLLRQTLDGSLPVYSESDDFESAWQLYLQVASDDRSQRLLVSLLNYLSFSTRPIDEVRTMFLLGSSPALLSHSNQHGTATSFWSAIISQIRRGSLEKAVTSHEHAIAASVKGYTGTNLLLAHLIHRRKWDLALQVYTTKMASVQDADKDWLQDDRTNIWDITERLPALTQTAIQFLLHVKNNVDYTYTHIRQLIDHISVKAGLLGVAHGSPHVVSRLMQALRAMGLDTPHIYQTIISSLTDRLSQNKPDRPGFAGNYQLLLDLYGRYRTLPDIRPPIGLLNGVATIILESSIPYSKFQSDVTNVLWDYDLLLGIKSIPASIHHLVMKMHADRGEVEKVNEIFDNLSVDGSITPEAAHSLLLAHAMRADPDEVSRQIDRLRNDFNWLVDESGWSILLEAYAKADNLEKCIETFNKALTLHPNPLPQTFLPLLKICADRGSSKKIIELLELAKSKGVTITMSMFSPLVMAHCNNKDLQAAEEAADALTQAWKQGQLEGSITHPWNTILAATSEQCDLATTNRIFRYMQEHGIEANSLTYHGLMTGLCLDEQPDAAWGMLTKTLPQKDILVSPMHYTTVMKGFCMSDSQYEKAILAYEHMLQGGIEPDVPAKLEYLRAIVNQKIVESRKPQFEQTKDPHELEATIQKTLNDIATHSKILPMSSSRFFNSTPYELAIESLMKSYTQGRRYGETHRWYNKYLDDSGRKKKETPMVILTALLSVHWKEGRHEYVEIVFNWILSKAKRFAVALSLDEIAGLARGQADQAAASGNDLKKVGNVDVLEHASSSGLAEDSSPFLHASVTVEEVTATPESITSVTENTIPVLASVVTAADISRNDIKDQADSDHSLQNDEFWDTSPFEINLALASATDVSKAESATPNIIITPEPILPLLNPNAPRLYTSRTGILNSSIIVYMKSILRHRSDATRNKVYRLVMGHVEEGWTFDNVTWNILVRGLIPQGFSNKMLDASRQNQVSHAQDVPSSSLQEDKPSDRALPQQAEEDALSPTEKTFIAEPPITSKNPQVSIAQRKATLPSLSKTSSPYPTFTPKSESRSRAKSTPTLPSPSHILSAFRITETLLMDNFPGWVTNPRPLKIAKKHGDFRGGFYWMDTRLWIGKRVKGREWLCPQLETLLDLRDCLREIETVASSTSETPSSDPVHRKILQTGSISTSLSHSSVHPSILLQALRLHAPRTLLAIQTIPLIGVPSGWTIDPWAQRMGWECKEWDGSQWIVNRKGSSRVTQFRVPRIEEREGIWGRDWFGDGIEKKKNAWKERVSEVD
jgi:pentatricopeptide repeat-containing protein PET309